MLLFIEQIPLRLHFVVVFEFGIGLYILEAHLYIVGQYIAYYHGIDAFALILGVYCYDKKVEACGAFEEESLKYVEPAEGEQFAFCFLQCFGE